MILPLLFLISDVTFYRDVEPVFQRRCQSCHRPGEVENIPLIEFEDAKPWAKEIRLAVKARTMPPFYATKGGPFANQAKLTDEEVATIEAWVAEKAPRGSRRSRPKPVNWLQGWNMQTPELVLTAPRPFELPAKGDIDYQMLILPMHLLEDKWVNAVEIRPGARRAVHHITAYILEPESEWLKDAPRGQYFPSRGAGAAEILAVYTPGQPAFVAPQKMAKRVKKGSELVLEFHYMPNGKAQKDVTTVGVSYLPTPPSHRILTLQLSRTEFRIPAGEANFRVAAEGTVPANALLLSMMPLMHLRGKAFEYELDWGEGQRETMLRVEPFHFHWQLSYMLASPKPLAKGTTVRATAWYDNSAANSWNPDSSKEVQAGRHSHEEVMVGYFDVAVDPKLDRRTFSLR